jgi:hypothetical protein
MVTIRDIAGGLTASARAGEADGTVAPGGARIRVGLGAIAIPLNGQCGGWVDSDDSPLARQYPFGEVSGFKTVMWLQRLPASGA